MAQKRGYLQRVQQLVMDLAKVERNHSHIGSDRHENVVEHSYSVVMLCWRLYEELRPPLDFAKIMKYSLAHDLLERGLLMDVNTFASKGERDAKKEREALELERIKKEFADFEDLVTAVDSYERREDGEALFVWTVDKMQAMILGEMDGWRPYRSYGVTWGQYCEKSESTLERCSPYLKETFTEVYEHTKQTYYDRPRG